MKLSFFKKNTKKSEVPPSRQANPRGLNRSLIPKEWIDGNKNPVWDRENPLFKNKIYL